MSKVISFSISDRYLDKLRSLYPSLTDNLAVKQFVTDRLSNSLDDNLDDGLDGKLKSLIESELDGILDERLDAVMGKLISSLSERIERLEERLDTNLDGRLDDMELLLRMQREASIASLLPTIEETVEAAIKPVATVETADKVETAIETVETVTDTVETVTDTVENDSTTEPVTDAIEDLPKVETVSTDSSIEPDAIASVTGNGMSSAAAHRFLISKNVKIAPKSLDNWIKNSKIPKSRQGKEAQEYIYIKDKKYYAIE